MHADKFLKKANFLFDLRYILLLLKHFKITNLKWLFYKPKLNRIVLKIEQKCFANCIACEPRKEHYKSKDLDKKMEFDDYAVLLRSLTNLDCREVILSGGEPLLYKDLLKLIEKIKKCNMKATVNTNGGLLTEDRARNLIQKGVDKFIVSIDSSNCKVHDNIRRCQGLFGKAIRGLKSLGLLKKTMNKKFKIGVRTILSRYNYKDLSQLIAMVKNLGANFLDIDYVEYDFKNRNFLLNTEETLFFRNSVLNKMIDEIQKMPNVKFRCKLYNIRKIKNIYDKDLSSLENFSNGIYWSKVNPILFCDLPKSFMLILKNGDVAPCPAVDFTQKPVLGNLFHKNLEEIWYSEEFKNFRDTRMEFCKYCPICLSTTLDLM